MQSNRIGVGRRTAYGLAAIGLDVVQRSTIRAMLPVGTTWQPSTSVVLRRRAKGQGPSTNRTSSDFGDALARFERLGWIERGRIFIRVIDAEALRAHALKDLPPGAGEAYWLDIERAIAELKATQANPTQVPAAIQHADVNIRALVEQRRRELIALQRLMEGSRGDRWSGRGSVRFAVRGRTI